MPDYLQRDQASLGIEEWAAIDQTVVRTAQAVLVGRRFINLVGPFGPGIESLPNDVLDSEAQSGAIDLLGNVEIQPLGTEHRRFLPVPLLYRDFWLHWRDLEATRQMGVPLDVGKAAAAAAATAQAEDRLIFDGDATLELPGLRTVEGSQSVPMRDWSEMGNAFADVVDATRVLIQAGFSGPYALAVSPRLYADLNRVFDDTGVLELEQVEKLARRGVYPAAVLPERSALLVDSGTQNMDLAIGLDLSTAYVESTNLNHRLRVIESLVLRIRRPGSVCVFEALAPRTTSRTSRQAANSS
jgi:uncharacterized linocin/CFP29 family protein